MSSRPEQSAGAASVAARAAPAAIVGTAGHIDHGKSALVEALTGTNPDRLPEERARGISIELGFAHLDLDGIGRIGIVDVPGHERFIRQMLAGAHGFDLVLVCVAADDGVMPQTEEHFDIVHLLGVRRALFVITKTDLVPASRIREVTEEIAILAVGTPYENASVCAVSARTGDGLDSLRTAVCQELSALADLDAKPADGAIRIPVDRVFVQKGHGVVVTGTAVAGRVAIGDDIAILPASRIARVREIQVHGEHVDTAFAGQRVALNLAGVDLADVSRGDTIARPDSVAATTRIDARVEIRPAAGKAVRSHVRVRVHHGTREARARLVWLDGVREIAPRASGFAQLTLEDAIVAAPGDRFVIRDETASRTIGGGVVLLAEAAKHRASKGAVVPALERIAAGTAGERLEAVLSFAREAGVAPAEAARSIGLTPPEILDLVRLSPEVVALPRIETPEILLTAASLRAFAERLEAAVADFEKHNPEQSGVDLEHLRGTMKMASGAAPRADAKTFRLVVDRLVADDRLERIGNVVRTRGHAPRVRSADDAAAERLLALVAAAGATPPTIADAAAALGLATDRTAKIAAVLARQGRLVRITPEIFYTVEALDRIRAQLVEHLTRAPEIRPAEFRDLIAASRKYCIPLLDWFDRSGVTIRVGDARKLRPG